MLSRWGVRSRVLAVSLVVLLMTLALWTWLLYALANSSLEDSASQQGTMLAQQVSATLSVVEPARAVPERPAGTDIDVVIQVVGAGGIVLADSRADAERVPMVKLSPPAGLIESQVVPRLTALKEEEFVVTGLGATGVDGAPLTVLVASPVHLERENTSRTVLLASVTAAAALGVAALLVGWAVAASLRPVERLRSQLAGIGGRRIGDRVDVPVTGDELTRLAETMNQMLARLEGAYAAQAGFVSDASHELRSPLATLRTSVEISAADPTGQVWQDTRPVVMAEILRLQRLVDDLLTLSRYDAGAMPLRPRECDLDDLVVEAARRTAEETHIHVAVLAEPVRANADPDRVGQVLRNLLDNAVRHARTGVRVGLEADDGVASVTVDNDGPVVPPEDRQRIFERFVRLDATRGRDTGGAGLGLAIAADIAAAHGGSLAAGEAEDGWCRFELRIPLG